ncbi:hypothetical protein EV127DRAFT_167780 [Xylaria flabelliformis]|nr:hypothetical protein EV127DRAFT_167780 [Xylaria flabelliformis]
MRCSESASSQLALALALRSLTKLTYSSKQPDNHIMLFAGRLEWQPRTEPRTQISRFKALGPLTNPQGSIQGNSYRSGVLYYGNLSELDYLPNRYSASRCTSRTRTLSLESICVATSSKSLPK